LPAALGDKAPIYTLALKQLTEMAVSLEGSGTGQISSKVVQYLRNLVEHCDPQSVELTLRSTYVRIIDVMGHQA
jgi:hypothetical protein